VLLGRRRSIGASAGMRLRVGPEAEACRECHSVVVSTDAEHTALERFAPVAAACSIAFGAAALVTTAVLDTRFRSAGRSEFQQVAGAGLAWLTGWVASAGVGAVLLVRRPRHPTGWLFTAMAVTIALAGLCEAYALYGLFIRAESLPGAASAAAVTNSIFIVTFMLVALVCSLTPDGRYLSARWRRSSHVMIGASMVWIGLRIIGSAPLEEPFASVENPWALTSVDLGLPRAVAAMVSNALVLAAAASLVVRYRRAEGDARRQLMWIAIAAVPVPVLLAVAFVAAYMDQDVLVNVAAAGLVALVPLGAGLAVTRYHLYDVDRILSRALTYLIVTGLLVGTYVAMVVVLARIVGQAANRSPTATTLATLVAVAAARPVYSSVREAVDRRFQRRSYEALRQVREFVADPSPDRNVETVLQEALGDPTLRVAYMDANARRWLTEDGHEVVVGPNAVRVERGGRPVAAVSSALGDPSEFHAVLREAAPELDNAGLRAAIAVQLEEVRASRERIAEAQVDERRRIERDLHDGAQQRLLGAAAQMRAALLNGGPERMREALELGVCESRRAVSELRSLANGLHPAVLEDGGLGAALDELATRLPVSVVVGEPRRRYPPMVEATMWFVACEAVANATKHAVATKVDVRLDLLDGELRLVVEDNGRGGADTDGSGLRGITDRVEAAGGHLTITSVPSNGTHVEAVLPCAS
jgi:signal transduction histidine kinase